MLTDPNEDHEQLETDEILHAPGKIEPKPVTPCPPRYAEGATDGITAKPRR